MTKFKDKKRVVVFLSPEDYEMLEEQRWQMKKQSVSQVILTMIAYCLVEIANKKKIDD
jgi:hypothetical protein